MGVGRPGSRPASTRKSWAVTRASSRASCGSLTGTPNRSAVWVSAYPRARRAPLRGPVHHDRHVAHVDHPPAPRGDRSAEQPAQERDLDVGEPRDQEPARERVAEPGRRPACLGRLRQVDRPQEVDRLGCRRRRGRWPDQLARALTPPAPCPVRSARRRRRSRGLCRDRGRSSRSRAPPSASSATRGRGADAARPVGDRLGRAPDHLLGRHDRVHPQVEGAGRQVLAAPAARGAPRPPGTRRRASVAGTGRRSRRRTPPGGPPRSTATAGVTITSKADGSIDVATGGLAGAEPRLRRRLARTPGAGHEVRRRRSPAARPRTPRPTSASISGIVESSEPNDEKREHRGRRDDLREREHAIGDRGCGSRTVGRIGRVARGQHPPAHLALGALQLARRHDRRVSAIRSSRSGGPAASGTIHVAPVARTRSRRRRRSSTVPRQMSSDPPASTLRSSSEASSAAS